MGSDSRPSGVDLADDAQAPAVPTASRPTLQLGELGSEVAAAEYCPMVLPWTKELATELAPLNRPATPMARTVLGSLPKLRALQPEIEQRFTPFNMQWLDRLEPCAWALIYVDAVHAASREPNDGLAAYGARGEQLREALHADAVSLAVRGLMDRRQMDEIKHLRGYAHCARSLHTLTLLYRQAWPRIQDKCTTTMAEIEEAESSPPASIGSWLCAQAKSVVADHHLAPLVGQEATLSCREDAAPPSWP